MKLLRRKLSKRKTKRGGSKIYNRNGTIRNTNETLEGRQFFRKMTTDPNEHAIAKILMAHPHPNIATIYRIEPTYIDMELLIPVAHFEPSLVEAMAAAKDHLQSLDIMYIDWKTDNIGLAADGKYKLFDFDASGIINKNSKAWTSQPPAWWALGKATEKGLTDPYEINNFSFKRVFTQPSS